MSGDALVEALAELVVAWDVSTVAALEVLAAHDAAIRAEAWDEALREVQAQAGRYGAAVSRTFLARSCERAYDALRAAQPTEGES